MAGRQVRWQQKRMDEGRCVVCGRSVDVSAVRCRECLLVDRLRARRRTGSEPWREGHPGRPPVVGEEESS